MSWSGTLKPQTSNHTECPFCTKRDIQSRVIARNDHAWAFPTNAPIVPGHILVCPIRCVPSLDDLLEEELIAIFELRREIKEALIQAVGAQGFNFAWNDLSVAGQTVPHLHLHVVPRRMGDEGIWVRSTCFSLPSRKPCRRLHKPN